MRKTDTKYFKSFSENESACREYERGSTPLVLDYAQLVILFCITTVPQLYPILCDSTVPQPCRQDL